MPCCIHRKEENTQKKEDTKEEEEKEEEKCTYVWLHTNEPTVMCYGLYIVQTDRQTTAQYSTYRGRKNTLNTILTNDTLKTILTNRQQSERREEGAGNSYCDTHT